MLHTSFAEKGTFVNEVKFIQYLDENTALEEVRNGNLDIYFFRVSSDRIETEKDREGIQVFESTGGSYSMLVNPSISETFNPFSITELRFALNYLVDRNLIVNELIGGYGKTIIVRHKYGYKTLYAHLSSIFVKVGQYVKQGQIIGRSGNTGFSTGPHLHFGIKLNGRWINPANKIVIVRHTKKKLRKHILATIKPYKKILDKLK
jgi:ABC-type transport system substrate-binding protein